MAYKFSCDGCGSQVDKPNFRGMVKLSHYCDTCTPRVDEYLKARDAIHTELAAAFKERLTILQASAHEQLARLPDEPA